MRGFRNINHYSYTFSFLLVFVMLILVCPAYSINANILSSTESLTVSNNRTIVSPGGLFELGFFKPGTSSRWYLGIWYKKTPEETFVWVANRDRPLPNAMGTLKLSDTNLVLLDHSNTLVWSTNLTRGDRRSSVVAELLANGNLVLRYSSNSNPSGFLWQSFHFPTDTLLPQMKLGWDRKTGRNIFLRSWRSSDDPSTGKFSYRLETRSFPEFFIWQTDVPMYRSGPWDGVRFSGMVEMRDLDYMVYNFTDNQEEVVYTFLMTNHDIYSRLTMSPSGSLQQITWKDEDRILSWLSPTDPCDACIKGFEPKIQEAWAVNDGTSGCVRKTRLSCTSGDGFFKLKNTKLPDTTWTIVDKSIDVEECKKRCLSNCNCTAYANTDIRNGGSGCVIWTGVLKDIRNYPATGQELYVKLARADLEDGNRKGKVIGLIVGITFCFWRRKQKQARAIPAPFAYEERNQDLLNNWMVISSRSHFSRENRTDELELPLMEIEAIIIATNNFSHSNKIGEGGFGVVYKGNLLDGQEIAVKRLSKTSIQGTNEFMNEVRLIARLQHIDLVRLLGCCIDTDEKILIYEYLENLSLDSYLFDKTRSYMLNWQMRFDITNGIARGLLYLHQDSRFRIIHRDLKASNVLLDKYITPKISDFGMARIFGRDETEANTRKVVGTYGYMSPEYAMDGIFSMKSDVFSFGVLLLEIISGRRNKGFYNSHRDLNLLGCVWRHWEEGKGLEIVDPIIIDSSSSTFQPQEILRCIQIGLLCVQEGAEDRPMMSEVVLMFGSETTTVPQPKPPGYCVGRSLVNIDSSSSNQGDDESWSVNQITLSVLDAR
ncbi:hypothetical protein CARUB_v10006283mg [Capsella rubella]|uniref:Receptor-like serine/threonine-protein kinase n=1 Tax=Capsella rubella TaxID=81985 RepID=R0GLW7_9BRAS|nr:hypothetical protein CARUB_v10006283mg [Capsella rubella]